jgi:hypothetical protein
MQMFQKSLRMIVALGVMAVVAGGCAPQAKKRESHLKKAVEDYNNEVRWQRFDSASKFVVKKYRGDFIEAYENQRDTLNITNTRVVSAEVEKEDPERGVARVWISYYRLPDTSLRKELVEQEWVYDPELENWYIDLSELREKKATSYQDFIDRK